MNITSAYFAGGCFWCITPTFAELEGVSAVTSGYSGGEEINPVYEEVKAQLTGHRETIKITYDSDKVSFGELLDIFLSSVDPFDGEGQFIDRGHSYTLAVYWTEEKERSLALQRLAAVEAESGMKTYVSVEPFTAFYDAEEYHQDYYKKNPEAFEEEMRISGRKK